MKAIVQDRYGPAGVLRTAEIERPEPGAGEIVVRVRAAGLDPSVWHLMTGLPYMMRLMGFGLRRPKDRVRGWDAAGTVAAVGAGVTRFAPGDDVFGVGRGGTFAEYCRGAADMFAAKPADVDFDAAAAAPTSAVTALRALRDAGGLRTGGHVLVLGAGGGVGTFAVQLAKARGAEVTGVCGTDKTGLVRSLGADHVVDYTERDVTAGTGRYDLVLDTAGNRPLASLRRVLAPRGTVVLVGGEGGGRWVGDLRRSLGGSARSVFSARKVRAPYVRPRPQDVEEVRGLLASGTIRPVVGRRYPLAGAAEAVRDWEKGHTRGKSVLVV